MSSKTEPLRLHVALFNSLRTIKEGGGGKERVTALRGSFSQSVYNRELPVKSRFVRELFSSLSEVASVRWIGEATTIDEVLEDLERDGVPDLSIENIEFAVPWTEWNQNTLRNEMTWLSWRFFPYTFRRGIWERLKAEVFPSQATYQRFKEARKEIGENVNESTRKRWRDALLLNQPKRDLSNQEIRQIWSAKPYALLLKESRGDFSLMDLGEFKE